MTAPLDGPSLETYVETRFNLLTASVQASAESQGSALGAAIEASKAALAAVKLAAEAALAAADIRYQQRFEAQSDALAAAFLSQQTAMQTAFVVAEKAVQAALAAADRAVSKAELASDKRFEALNELRQMLNDMVANLIPRIEAAQRFDAMGEKTEANSKRLDGLEVRLTAIIAERVGGQAVQDNTKAYLAMTISVVLAILTIASFVIARLQP
jgi:hypothetical protein